MSKAVLINPDIVRTLAHIALLAAWEEQGAAAEHIFAGLEAHRPQAANIRVCRAMAYAIQDRSIEARALLEAVLAKDPYHIAAKGLLGMVRFAVGEPGWQTLLEDVVADGFELASAELARRILSDHRELRTVAQAAATRFISYA